MLKTAIEQDYRVHWMLDSLPVAVRNIELGLISRGYPVGLTMKVAGKKGHHHYLYNHVRLTVRYNTGVDFEGIRIVGFEVTPMSIKVSAFILCFIPF